MNVFVPLGLILFIWAYLSDHGEVNAKRSFAFCFIIMFIFAALRYELGPDYFNYREAFSYLKSSDVQGFQKAYHDHMEIWFVRFFNLFNSYFIYIMVMSLIWHGVMYWFFKKYVHFRYYHVIILLMFFNVNLCLLNYVALRSSLASCFFFIGFICLISGVNDILIFGGNRAWLNKKGINLIFYSLFVFMGSMFHTSILIFLVFPFLTNTKNYSKNLSNTLLYIGVIISLANVIINSTLSKSLSLWLINIFPDYFDRYSNYIAEGELVNSAGIGALIFNLLKVIVAYPILNALTIEKDTRYIRIMQFSVVFLYMMLIIDNNMLSRYLMCFYPVIIIALLRSFVYSTNVVKQISLYSILLLSVYQLYAVVHSASSVSFLKYQTIFSAPYWQ